MLGLVVVIVWVGFVCSFLMWQQVTGDLSSTGAPRPAHHRAPSISVAFKALTPMEERLKRLARAEDWDRSACDLVSVAER